MSALTPSWFSIPFTEMIRQVEETRQMAYTYVSPAPGDSVPEGRLYILSFLEYALAIDVGLSKGVAITSVRSSFEPGKEKETWHQAHEAPEEATGKLYRKIPLHAFQYVRYRGLSLVNQLKLLNTLSGLEHSVIEPCRRCDWALFMTGRPDPCFQCLAEIKKADTPGHLP